jgi:cyclopropane fatty-acyl-phospholipid synthase-like methyltransferase
MFIFPLFSSLVYIVWAKNRSENVSINPSTFQLTELSNITHETVEVYYDTHTFLYEIYANNSLHYGMWNKQTKNSQDAIENTNRFVAANIDMNQNDVVLDAGCGVGGPAIFMAENYGAKVIGITLSKVQQEIGRKNANKSFNSHRIEFYQQDYTRTSFKDSSFTKIYGIESICHASNKSDFLNEAYRILRNNGKLIVLDGFLIKHKLTANEQTHLDNVLRGWCVPNLSHVDEFKEDLENAGFVNIKLIDATKEIEKSIRTIYINGLLIFPISWILAKLKWIPKSYHDIILPNLSQKKLHNKKIGIYGAFIAEKS